MTQDRANANPSKTFFITMLTRDIDLVDCVLDLLDNSVDGITEAAKRAGIKLDPEKPFAGKRVDLTLNKDTFGIVDRSGGIPIDIARDYAFRFGRPDDAPDLKDGTIGLYGIGMKRAIFKIGETIKIVSSTGTESFGINLDVPTWRADPQVVEVDGEETMDWSFEMIDVRRGATDVPVGTSIRIGNLYEGVSRQLDNSIFVAEVRATIARDYAFILNRGLEVYVNDVKIEGVMPVFRTGTEIEPFRHVEEDDGVRIEITVGLADPPPDDTSATARRPDISNYGWYIVCNDRVVVSADKSMATVWGRKPVPAWHPQYIGFMGVARFDSADPKKLPWKTTKRDVEASNTFYQRALPAMIRATKRLVDYTNERQAERRRLKKIEKAAPAKAVTRFAVGNAMKLPTIETKNVVTIQYVREEEDVTAAAEALGIVGSSPAEVGVRTFEYYLAREVRK